MQTSSRESIDFYERRGFWGEESLDSLFRRTVAIHPRRLALCDPPDREFFADGAPKRLSYSELFAAVRDTSAKLLAAGLQKDQVIVVQLPNTVETVILYLAIARIGALLCPVSIDQNLSSLTEISLSLRPYMYVGGRYRHRNLLRQACAWLPESCIFASFQTQSDGNDIVDLSLDQPAKPEDIRHLGQIMDANLVTPNEVFTLTWKRYTDRYPAIPRTHNQWFALASFVAEGASLCNGDSLLCAFPLSEASGIGALLYNWLMTGGKMVLSQTHRPETLLQQLREENIICIGLTPQILITLAPTLKQSQPLPQLRSVITGFSHANIEDCTKLVGELNINLLNCYSTSEGASLLTAPADRLEGWQEPLFPRFEDQIEGWQSRMSRMVRTRLKSSDSLKEITEPGQPGTLFIKGPSLFDHYYTGEGLIEADEEIEPALCAGGYKNTGDLFVIDEQNPRFYRFIGRIKSTT